MSTTCNHSGVKERTEKLKEVIAKNLKKQEQEERVSVDQLIGQYLIHLVDDGRTDMEMYSDACKDILRAIKEDDEDEATTGDLFMNRLPKFTRNNIIEWINRWQVFFYGLSCYPSIYTLVDYWRVYYCGGITIEELEALEAKYLNEPYLSTL